MSKEEKQSEKQEQITVRDFKSMIDGMDMILGEDWTPTEDQWKRIRKKINALIATELDRPAQLGQPIPTGPGPAPDAGTVDLSNFPQVPSSIPEGPIQEGVPEGPSALGPPPAAPTPPATPPADAPIASGQERVKTPDVDSSKGYKSSFV